MSCLELMIKTLNFLQKLISDDKKPEILLSSVHVAASHTTARQDMQASQTNRTP
jgi:hypothetical protein